MGVKFRIEDSTGTGNQAKVSDHNLHVITSGNPAPITTGSQGTVFFQYFTDDGTSTGSSDMLVDGSTTNVDFWISSSATADRYISEIGLVLAWPTAQSILFGEFGNDGAVLTNGIDVLSVTETAENYIRTDMKSNGEVVLLANAPDFVQYRSMFAANDYGIKANLELHDVLPPFGLSIRAGSKQKLVIRIKDDLAGGSGATLLQASVLGFDRLIT